MAAFSDKDRYSIGNCEIREVFKDTKLTRIKFNFKDLVQQNLLIIVLLFFGPVFPVAGKVIAML